MGLRAWWKKVWREEYELIITVPGEVTIHTDGSRTEKKTQQFYQAKKIAKATPKYFLFYDLNDGDTQKEALITNELGHLAKALYDFSIKKFDNF